LIIQGEKDFQVKAETDFVLYQKMLSDHPNVNFKLYEGLNHKFTSSYGTNSIKDYKIPGTVSSEVTDDIASWINGIG
jgi:dipeptidyl aminopeptidase/acylaminoacyl peptidase